MKKKTILLIIALLLVIIGTSYAAYNWTFTGNTNTISTSGISLKFLESNSEIINITNALPMGCTEGKQQAQTFDFSVTSTTTRDVKIKYTLNIEKLEVDSGYTALQDSDIALYLTDYAGTNELLPSSYSCSSGISPSPKSVPVDEYKNIKPMLLASTDTTHISLVSQLSNYKLYSKIHTHDSSHNVIQDKFKLRVWIAPDVDASSWTSSTKLQYKFKIGLTSEEYTSSYVYRYGTDAAYNGSPLAAGTYNGYCAINTNEDYNSCTGENFGFLTQDSCNSYINGWDGATCQSGSWTTSGVTYTDDATTLNKQSYLRYNIGSQTEPTESFVCYTLNSEEYCLKGGDTSAYNDNKQVLSDSFGASNCTDNTTYYSCSSGGLYAFAYSIGDVSAGDDVSHCDVDDIGNSICDDMILPVNPGEDAISS